MTIFKRLTYKAAAICAAAVASVSLASSADAMTTSNASGSFAAATVPSIVGGDICNYMTGPSYTGCVYSPTVRSNDFTVDRSRGSSGDQLVTVDYQVWRYESGWYKYTAQRSQALIKAGQPSARVPGLSRSVEPGSFGVTATIAWWTAGSTWLGQYSIAWPTANDFYCRTTANACTSGPGWVKLGG